MHLQDLVELKTGRSLLSDVPGFGCLLNIFTTRLLFNQWFSALALEDEIRSRPLHMASTYLARMSLRHSLSTASGRHVVANVVIALEVSKELAKDTFPHVAKKLAAILDVIQPPVGGQVAVFPNLLPVVPRGCWL